MDDFLLVQPERVKFSLTFIAYRWAVSANEIFALKNTWVYPKCPWKDFHNFMV